MPFVPDDFTPPTTLDLGWATLRPLAASDNPGDYAAWHGSIAHIAATPGYADRTDWPVEDYSLEQNEHDLAEHEVDFAERKGFTFTVLDQTGTVIGCVYFYPPREEDGDADVWVRSWVSADHAAQDVALFDGVNAWLDEAWPWDKAAYAAR